MMEQEWLACDDPQRMLAWCRRPRGPFLGLSTGDPRRPNVEISDRKLRLFACACCRAVWDRLPDERSRRAVEVAERFADGKATEEERAGAWDGVRLARRDNPQQAVIPWLAATLAMDAVRPDGVHLGIEWFVGETARLPSFPVPPATQAALLRDIVGHPWRLSTLCGVTEGIRTPADCYTPHCPNCAAVMTHADGLVPRIARSIYDRHAWGEMALLADALEDSSCQDTAILAHCREPLHARGCWVVDLILGRD